MKTRDMIKLGIPQAALPEAIKAMQLLGAKGNRQKQIEAALTQVLQTPEAYLEDPEMGALAAALQERKETACRPFIEREAPAPCKIWGTGLEAGALDQMKNACDLPVAVAGALMPDAHSGYGLPIGGVLATENCVIPYAVGMDIACRMKMTVLDLPVSAIRGEEGRLRNALERETEFGVGGGFSRRHEHNVMDADWSVSPVTKKNKDKAWFQLGSSGSGNHFVEFGTLTLEQDELGLKAGTYVALLSHSGSRGTGGEVAKHYSSLAMDRHPELPKQLKHLAWLDLDSQAGQEYWQAMELMGRYAAANHELIHRFIARNLGVEVLADVENHHNFAWKEQHFGKEVVVHRKGATPATTDTLGIIPGSMATPGFVVRGKGCAESMNSASHGAGRAMSRTATKNSFTWNQANRFLADRDVILISAGLDEVPMGYKDIHEVMAAQTDLVDVIARFDPKLVKMAPEEHTKNRRGPRRSR
ncbi:MAG: RtcB family protein [Pontiellaceae bacterium]|nr:RtcB family protein [Pontiellaceae bacterium]MBN2785730.1 RtcB family protein [Pontiellaceae bacterium]